MEKLFEEAAICRISIAATGVEQMTIDEALWRGCTVPTLRFYRWTSPEITFGYPMKWKDVTHVAAGRPSTRRCTGGGIVEHGNDLTICLAIPHSHPLAATAPLEVYAAIHQALKRGIPHKTALAGHGTAGLECFTAPSTHDLLVNGRKVLGGALRRGRPGLLYQGSLQMADPPTEIQSLLAESLADHLVSWKKPVDWAETVSALRMERYGSAAWNRKR